MFGFVAYQLWGTGIETARAQNKLETEFEALLAAAPVANAPDFVAGSGTVTEPTATIPSEPSNQADATDPDTATPASTDQPVDVTPVAPAAAVPPVPVADQNIPSLENGDALARIEIPTIGVSDIVVAGVETRDLKKGPGHFPDTPLPGQLGNAAIAGHRTTYGQPFHNVDKLAVGDEIVVTTLSGRFIYAVTGQQIVAPSDYHVIATTDPNRATLTLTSCHPKWTAEQRIVIFSELISEESAPVGEPVLNYGRPDEPAADEPAAVAEPALPGESTPADASNSNTADSGNQQATPDAGQTGDDQTDAGQTGGSVTGNLGSSQSPEAASSDAEALGSESTNDGIADAFSEGWFSDPSANPHVAFWAMLLALITIGGYYISRRFRSYWIGSLIGVLPFVVALYFFYQNVNRLLPPNL
jgi:sortase A